MTVDIYWAPLMTRAFSRLISMHCPHSNSPLKLVTLSHLSDEKLEAKVGKVRPRRHRLGCHF